MNLFGNDYLKLLDHQGWTLLFFAAVSIERNFSGSTAAHSVRLLNRKVGFMHVLSNHRSRAAAIVVGSLGAAVVISGAGVGANAAPTPKPVTAVNTASCAPQDGIDKSTIKLAFITSATGGNAAGFAGSFEAASLRLAQENAKGGIFGRKLVLQKYDDNSNGATQLVAASQAIDRDKNFGVLNIVNAETMYPILDKASVPTIGLVLPSTGLYRSIFGAAGTSVANVTTTSGAKRVAQTGAKTMATIAFPVPAALQVAAGFAKSLPLVGMTNVLAVNDAPFGAYDATSTALKIKSSGAEGAYLVLQVDGGLSVMSALKQQGVSLKAPFMAGLSDPIVIEKAKGGLDGVIGSTYGTVPPGVTGRPGLRTYTNAMLAAGFNPYGPNPPSAYVSADTMIKGLKLAGPCPTRVAVVNQLRNQSKITGAGLLPEPISYKPGLSPNGNPAKCTWFIQVISGKMVPDKAPTCGDYMDATTGQILKG